MTILWDWNGTLLADVPLVVRVDNQVFAAHGYPSITQEAYLRAFRFPVIDYYRALGVADNDFPAIARDFAEVYAARFDECSLRPDAAETVRRFPAAGFRQAIISASQLDQLREQVARFPALNGMFADILGLGDIYAVSKVALARDYLARSALNPADAVFLGDTGHDAEVATAIGCRCLLISGGHQPDEVLASAGAPILPSLTAAADLLGA